MQNVIYIVINQDLNMSPGKIGAHCAHAIFDYIYRMQPDKDTVLLEEIDIVNQKFIDIYNLIEDFKFGGDTIIVCKAHEKDLIKWEKEGYAAVRDRGYTEVEPSSITAVCLGMYDKDKEIPKWIQRLRLL